MTGVAENDRFEYETLRPPRGETKKESEDPKTQVNELAAEGWRLVETIDYTGGGTKYLVFERPVRAGTDDERDGNGGDGDDGDGGIDDRSENDRNDAGEGDSA